MNKIVNRKNSKSPLRSIEINGKRQQIKKPSINTKQVKSNDDVQVFTSLPPNVEGDIKFYLRLKILNINLINENSAVNNKAVVKKLETKPDILIAKCSWWGEEKTAALFRPKIQSKVYKTENKIQTCALYMVRSGTKQFNAYLNDMGTLDISLLNENTMQIIGRVQIFEIGQLSVVNPIKGYFSAFDESQKKIADVNVSIELESLKDLNDVRKSYDLSDHSRPATPSSLANINDFNTKYEEFERNQLKKNKLTESYENNNKNSKFNSITYKTEEFINNNDENTNPIIANLIQKAEKLKNEMIKSTASNLNIEKFSLLNNNKLDSFNEYIDESYDLDFNENATFEHSYLFDSKFGYFNKEEVIENDSEDKELKELLHPSSLFTRLIDINGKQTIPIQNNNNKDKMLYSRETPQRPYSATNSCYSSDDDDHQNYNKLQTHTNNNNNRNVSFDIQSSSDGESSIASSNENDQSDFSEILSPQRLSLLNLVQITRLKIDNIDFYSSFSNNILKSIENGTHEEIKTKLINSKPPKAVVKSDLNQSFFIEYQFPVIASRYANEDNLNATQLMRVMPKRLNKTNSDNINNNNKIQFDHNADYSVLFSSKSIENWWKSYIVFKIYLRQQQTATTNKTVPQLIGIARLKLRNLLKSRNFKLIKKLAILDQTSSSSSKRVGTLNVSVELSSDLNEFIADLHKLKIVENNKQFSKPIKSISKSSIVSTQTNNKPPGLAEQTKITNKPFETPIVVEQTFPIDFYLSVSEGREFNNSFKNKIYLICRLFWNKEKIKLEENLNFNWTLNSSFMLRNSLIDNMRNNFMIIEAWVKNNNSQSDSLIGTLKLPLQEFYLKFNDIDILKHLLNDSITYTQPIIGVNGWISVLDPFSGFKSGELNILLAMGSSKQILNLQKTLFDQSRIKLNKTTPDEELKQHVFTISLEQIKLQPSSDRTFDETDYFVKYMFLNGNDLKFNPFIIATKFSSNFNNKVEHKLVLKEKNKEFMSLLLNKCNKDNDFIKFELWKRSYFPNLREKVLASGEILLEKILNLVIREQKKDSFIVPLILNDDSEELAKHDKFLGQLFIDIEYKCIEYFQKPDNLYSITNSQNEKQSISNNIDSNVLLSIGILRANRIQTLVKNISLKTELRNMNLENSEIYVKFSTTFINKPLDFKQTHPVLTKLNGYSPEFFDYFEIQCPLIAVYNSFNKRTVSLAEQLELGQIIFEIWSKTIDSNNTEFLLGTCAVPLEALLENRIGISGWLPIHQSSSSSVHLNHTKISENCFAGGLEIAIRFTKHDDYLKIINTAKDLGWLKGNSLVNKKNTYDVEPIKINIPALENINEWKQSKLAKKAIKCLIEIDKAVHLPPVYDKDLNMETCVNSFVSFNVNLDNPCDLMKTTICDQDSTPKWNQQFLANLDSEYFLDDKKYFILKVWHTSNRKNNDKLLGSVSIDLTPLICGLSHLSGWYNIQDSVGNCNGQIKVNILPQENLILLKQTVNGRKKLQNESKISSFGSRFDTAHCSSLSLPRLCSSDISTRTTELKISKFSNSTSDLFENINLEEYKSGLKQKLSELELLNKKLKERLEIVDIKKTSSTQNEELIAKLDNREEEKENEFESEYSSSSNEINVEQIIETTVAHNNNNNNDNIDNNEIEIEATEENQEIIEETNENNNQDNNEITIQKIEDMIANESNFIENNFDALDKKPATNKDINDSFWLNTIENTDLLPNQLDNNDQILEVVDLVEENNNEKIEINHIDIYNETYLDQTINFNESFEKEQNLKEKMNDSVELIENNVIDCSKFDDDDNNNNNEPVIDEDEKPADLDIEIEENLSDENLIVINPEQINLIDETSTKTKDEINLNEKFKDISTKMPNYFLAENDLESKMKKLHQDYVQINSLSQIKTESEKAKSTIELINSNSNKQDLDRINKIFYSKTSTK